MERLGAFIKKHRLWLGGLCCALAAAFALAWAGYTLHQAGRNQSEYKIVHDEYVEKQGLYPADPAAGLVQGLPAGEGEPLYGVRLMFVTDGRVAQGRFRVALESADGDAAQTYANIIACRKGDENSAKIQALVTALESEAVRQYIAETYNGAVVAIF